MSKVYIVEYENNYGEMGEIGMCSTAEKANIVAEAMKEFDYENYKVREVELDTVFEEVKTRIEQSVENYKIMVSLLDRCNKLES